MDGLQNLKHYVLRPVDALSYITRDLHLNFPTTSFKVGLQQTGACAIVAIEYIDGPPKGLVTCIAGRYSITDTAADFGLSTKETIAMSPAGHRIMIYESNSFSVVTRLYEKGTLRRTILEIAKADARLRLGPLAFLAPAGGVVHVPHLAERAIACLALSDLR